MTSLPPVPLDDQVVLGDVVVTSIALAAVEAEAIGPGEIGGPGLAVAVELRNDGDTPIEPTDYDITVVDSTGAPGLLSTGGLTTDWSATTVQPGGSDSAVRVFTVPESHRSEITVLITDVRGATVASFVGTVS